MENTNQKVLSNIIWRFAERSGAQLVHFIVSIVLARILSPEAYGTVALITVFITILQVFVDSGLGNALIQKKDADDIDFSTVFYTNIFFCIIIYIIIFCFAPVIASFYRDPSITMLTRILGITILISGVKNIQQAYVSKKLIFKKFFYSTLAGTIGAAIVGIVMALNGYGIWALVAQHLFNLVLDTIVLWFTVKWRPKLVFSLERLKKLFSYGWKILLSSTINTTYQNIRQLIIGKFYSSESLAFFNKGKQLPNLIITNINKSIDSVLLPTMSDVQENKQKVREITRISIKVSTYIISPLMIGLIATSNNFIKLLLTEKWLPCVPYLCIFCFSYMFYPIHAANLNAIQALGKSNVFLKIELLKNIIDVMLLIYTMRISVIAMAMSLLISSITSQIINSWPNKKLIDYSYIEQIKDILPYIALSSLMGGTVYLFNFINSNIFIILIVQILIGGIFYVGLSKILRLEAYNYLINILNGFIKKEKK